MELLSGATDTDRDDHDAEDLEGEPDEPEGKLAGMDERDKEWQAYAEERAQKTWRPCHPQVAIRLGYEMMAFNTGAPSDSGGD